MSKVKSLIYTGVLGSFLRVGDAGDFSLFSGSIKKGESVARGRER